jgi:ABC-2 type transport system permease protein
LVLRYGLGAESFAWAFIFALAPLCGVYYPTTILPPWVQALSALLPASYIFNGMRAVLIEHVVRTDYLLIAMGLNIVWLAGGIGGFLYFHARARERGMLLQLGE